MSSTPTTPRRLTDSERGMIRTVSFVSASNRPGVCTGILASGEPWPAPGCAEEDLSVLLTSGNAIDPRKPFVIPEGTEIVSVERHG